MEKVYDLSAIPVEPLDLKKPTPTPEPYIREGEELENYKLHRRFDRMGRLVGDRSMKRLMDSHVMVIGLGGVGSWAAEAVARAGVGKISLVDFDAICITNANRQIHALRGKVGKAKSEIMAERLVAINPKAEVMALRMFYSAENSDEIMSHKPDFIIDAIDNITAKCHLLARCHRESIPVVCSTGASGRMDTTAIQIGDLANTTVDPLAREIRRILRANYDFPNKRGTTFGIPAVFSTEPIRRPMELHYDQGKGFQCVCPQKDNGMHTCDHRSMIYGTAGFLTGSFGLTCASVAIQALLEMPSVYAERQAQANEE